ncbi:MAG: hypothetical protein VXX46_04225 [Bacteroidota bacterium]|nr:hypothetical protein [Bacteroidota bacterium]
MKKTLPLILSILGLTFYLSSCGPDEDSCLVNCEEIKKAPQDARDYFLQPTGSWWEYELLDSNIVDTLRMFSVDSNYSDNKCTDGSDVCQYSYNTFLHHSNVDYFPKYSSGVESHEAFGIYPMGNIWTVVHSGANDATAGLGHFLTLPFSLGDKSNYIEVFDTDTDLNTTAGNFKCLHLSRDKNQQLNYDKRIMNLYMAKDVGLIRFEFKDGDIWQLKSYKINQ